MRIYKKVVSELKRKADKKKSEKDKIFHKYEGHKSYGLKDPEARKIYKRSKIDIQNLECGKAFELASRFYESNVEEVVMAGNYVLENRLDCFNKDNLRKLNKFAGRLISWSTTDDFCIDIVQPLLKRHPKEVLKLLKKWGESGFIWKKRASVVAFVRKVGESGEFTAEALNLCDNLIDSKKDLIQKAVGWCLKDVMRGDKKKVLKYVRELRMKGYPSTITLYAIRDLKGRERKEILDITK